MTAQLFKSFKAFGRQRPGVVAAAARVFDRVGAGDVASRLRRVSRNAPDAVLITPRRGAGAASGVRRPGFLMNSCDGRDQIVRTIWSAGWGSFEHPLPDVFAQLVRVTGGLVLDVGANTGFYSLLATRVSPTVRVQAFEPVPEIRSILSRNIALNDLDSRITVSDCAVGSAAGEATLHMPTDEHGQIETSASLDGTFKETVARTIQVPVTTLDDVARTAGEAIRTIKLDVESFEEQVLSGGLTMLREHEPIVFFELLPHVPGDGIERLRSTLDFVTARLTPNVLTIAQTVRPTTDTSNHVLLPAARLDDLIAAASAAGLSVTHERTVPAGD